MSLRIAIAGASGRMGRTLVETVLDTPDCSLVGAFDIAGSPAIGRDAGELLGRPTGVQVVSDPAQALSQAQVVIDFTRPEGSVALIPLCVSHGVAMVIGTRVSMRTANRPSTKPRNPSASSARRT